ncbi:unnamed protein product [Symbiodinium natans]|uniref:Uncharacterized protein n=1 Tax=Symbiodinium natans TaxID=878477 RepID=A0A812QS64_9DINO|nr:unnamed protein product [Symbiodinium natans]
MPKAGNAQFHRLGGPLLFEVAQLRSQLSMAEALSQDPSAASAISAALGASRRDRDAEELV